MKKITLFAPAKLNLALDVCGLLPGGYHTVDMLMQTVSIYEKVEISRSGGYSLRCPGSRVPCDERNTATKAARVFFTETGLLAGCDIIIHKKVPTRAGMAGGSADAAGVLVGLNALYNAQLTEGELCRLGAMVGADVPFAITGGTARVTGIGEVLQPLPPLPECWFVVAMPYGPGVSTPEAYARFDTGGSPHRPDMDAAAQAVADGDLAALPPHMHNALEHTNGGKATPKLRRIFDSHGAAASMMTGSGAAVFGLFLHETEAKAALKAVRRAAKQSFICRPVPHGPVAQPLNL